MKKTKFLLPILLLISAIIIGLVGGYLKYQVLSPLGLCRDQSIFAVPFILLADESVRYSIQYEKEQKEESIPSESVVTEIPVTQASEQNETMPFTEPATEPPTESIIESTLPTLDESWFDDALFIGDSRTVGLFNFSSMGEAESYCDVGMSIFATESYDLQVKLERGSYGKIYISLGLNEIMGPREVFLTRYQELIDYIRIMQPDAVIILQAVMTVGRDKADSDKAFSLENIQKLNEDIASLTDGDMIRFIDVNEWIADEEGYLPDEMSQDGVHLYGPYYVEWARWLLENAATLGID